MGILPETIKLFDYLLFDVPFRIMCLVDRISMFPLETMARAAALSVYDKEAYGEQKWEVEHFTSPEIHTKQDFSISR